MKLLALACIAVALVLLIILVRGNSEGFATKREKAETITSWWNKEPNPTYNKYRSANIQSDVVEYAKIKKLPEVTVDAVERIL